MRSAPYPVTLRQLQYIVAVAERRSFRKAAEDCHVAQPSLSAQIAQAEEALELQIFERDRTHVNVSAKGAELIARIRPLLLAADGLLDAARELSDPLAGTLRLGIIPTIGPYLLPEVASLVRKRFPKLTFLWSEEKTAVLSARLSAGELDGAVLALESDLPELAHVVLGKDPFVFAAAPGHPLVRAGGPMNASELEGERVLLLEDGHCFREQALSFCARRGVEEASYRATSLPTLVQMAAAGEFVTLLPKLSVPVENRRQTLRVRELSPKAPQRTIALVFRKDSARDKTLRAVGEALRGPCAKLLG